ncbi:serine/threonine-protein kinase [Actinocrispum wychmicini]|uniref:non-specific serine/threonine protein kinase n=1 Tax=Actinocrispum wychmicini TaxID=1213861 RepID=A0A4R2IUH6_9PSEU|nr:serine/threonine-protein kinase [Actinocrispum wychmicini]TCO46545.1 serine/threonine protein kinase [Actinocrispum wychmicini]
MGARTGQLVGGRYRLVAELGSGGFGRVWRAYDDVLHVDVAVKELRLPTTASDTEQADRLARAAREARNAAPLRHHPNIVSVHDVVIADDIPWIVMQLVEGCSIDDHVKSHGPLPPDRVTDIAVALLRALGAAHDAGILHRDVKPANVMLAANGEVLLTDFGIAIHRTDTVLTATGVFIGSMEYVAPERALGDETTAASDLFSLGATLYHAVEGISPFRRGEDVATLGAVLAQDPAPPTLAPPALAALIMRLLAKEPKRRPTVRQALAMITERPTDPHRTADHTVLLTRAATVMKAELARRLLGLAAEHGIAFTAPPATAVIPKKKPPTPTRKHSTAKPGRRWTWQRVGAYVILVLLLAIGIHGAAVNDWDPWNLWTLLEEDLGSVGGEFADHPANIFLLVSGFGTFFAVALPFAFLVGGRAAKAVAAAGKVVTFVIGLVIGVAGLGLGAAASYFTLAGLADLLKPLLDRVAADWTSLVVITLAVIIAYEWGSMKAKKAAPGRSRRPR